MDWFLFDKNLCHERGIDNLAQVVIHYGINIFKMDILLKVITDKTIARARSIKWDSIEALISSILFQRYNLDRERQMVKKAVKIFCQDDKTLTFVNYKWLNVRKHIGKDGLNLNDFGILQIMKTFMSFYIVFNNVRCLRCISISEQESTAYYIQISRDINKNSNNKSSD